MENNKLEREKEEGKGEKTENPKPEKSKIKNEEKTEAKSEKEIQEQVRVVINKEASDALESMLTKVTDGFEAGTITKSDLANWLIMITKESFGDSEVRTLRQLYFDERKILAALLRDSKDQNNIPESLKRAIRDHYGLSDHGKRRPQKESGA